MNPMTRLAIATLEHSDPSALEAWARERLTTHAGFTVFAPDDKDAADTWALDRVRAMGRRVVDADATVLPKLKAPVVGTTWTPTRHMVKGVWVPTWGEASARLVFALHDDNRALVYELPFGARHPCALSTWHVWVRRTRAVAS